MNRTQATRAAYLSELIYEPEEIIRNSVFPAVPFEFINKEKTDTQVGIFQYDDGTYIITRGTSAQDWNWKDIFRNAKISPVSWPPGGQAHSGYAAAALDVAPDIIKALLSYPRPWIFGGHSLGGIVTTHLTSYLAHVFEPPDITYTYGAPKGLDHEAAQTVPEPFCRFVYEKDIAPTYTADWVGYKHPLDRSRWHLRKDGSLTHQEYSWWHTMRPWTPWGWLRAKKDHQVANYRWQLVLPPTSE